MWLEKAAGREAGGPIPTVALLRSRDGGIKRKRREVVRSGLFLVAVTIFKVTIAPA